MGVARDFLDKALADFTGDQWLHQPCDGVNHALFNVGHLAASDAFFLKAIGGSSSAVPESWNELFGMGAEPKADAGAYPSPEETTAVLKQVRADLVAHFKSLSEADLAKPVNEPLNDVAKTLAALPSFIAMHDGMHAGQVLTLRKSLKKPYIMG